VRAFVTGATGFIGGRLAAQLRDRGDEVVALVRSPQRASALGELGCELIPGDLADQAAIRAAVEGCDGVFHVAAVYKVGIPRSERQAMLDSNVAGTAAVLDAAIVAGCPRILYVSTVNVFGNTHGQVVDEGYRRDLSEGFLSTYDEAKYRAHELAEERIANGAPIVIAQPGGVYGPDDHSAMGHTLEQVSKGRLPLIPFPDLGICLVHVDDAAAGILQVFDGGTLGETYLLCAEATTMRQVVQAAARIAGAREPRWAMPTSLIRLSAPLGPIVGPLMGFPPNFRELVSASDGVTYWATDAKARRELGFAPRTLEQGLRDTLAAA